MKQQIGVCLVVFLFSLVANADVESRFTYEPNDLHSAQILFSTTQETARQIISKKECWEAIEKSVGKELPTDRVIPINLINNTYWGSVVDGKLHLIEWGDLIHEGANTVCLKLKNKTTICYINVPLDVVLTSSYSQLAYIIAHETIHYYQGIAGYVWKNTERKAHKEVKRLLAESCTP